MKLPLFVAGVLVAASPFLSAADARFSERGQLLFSDDLSGPALAKEWAGKPGKWEMVDGAVKVSEVPEDKHAAVRRHPLKYHDAIFEFQFQLNGAKAIGLSLNQKGGHACRAMVNPAMLIVQVDQPTPTSDQKVVRLGTAKVKIEPGQWHKLTVEVRGQAMIAQVDDNPPVSGENARVDVEKVDFGIPVSGVSALVKGVKVFAVK